RPGAPADDGWRPVPSPAPGRGDGSPGPGDRARPPRHPATGAHGDPHPRAQPALRLRELRRRQLQPLRPRRLALGRRAARRQVQPLLRLRWRRARQDPPPPRDRPPRARAATGPDHRLRLVGDVHQRPDQRAAGQGRHGRVPVPLPRRRHPDDRRHPVHRRQGEHAGRVLPHLQRPPPERQAGDHHQRQAAEGDRRARGAAALPLRGGAQRRRPAARLRDADRDPALQGGGAGGPSSQRRDRVRGAAGRRQQHPGTRGGPQQDPRPGRDHRPVADDGAGDGGPDRHRRRWATRQGEPGRRGRRRRRPLRGRPQGPARAGPDQGDRAAPPGGDVPDPGVHRRLAGRHRAGARRAGPHHGDARHRQGRARAGHRHRAARPGDGDPGGTVRGGV
ncbi:MAG: Chromosomal replication initiator protein DnaA, partial [uncultured Thermomicrobiales bacterium]